MTDQRRRSRRHPTDWTARYRFDLAAEWRRSRVIDVSWEGAALELHGVGDDEPLDGVIYVQITSATEVGHAISMHGWIRHRARTAIGRVLVGVEFRRLDVNEMQVLRQLANQRAAV
jgi:PilZ domain-containing protein